MNRRTRRHSPWRTLAFITAALPFLGGAGTCGILYDLWSWDEITDHAERLHVDVTEGALEITAYDRSNIWIQRHVYAFEKTMEEVDYSVDEDAVAQVVFHCDGRATCFADHWLEIPTGMPVDVELGKGSVSLAAVDGPVTLDVTQGSVTGTDLAAPSLELDGGRLAAVTLAWPTATPTLVALTLDRADVSLTVPAGTYACDVSSDDGDVAIDPAIVCEDGADASLVIALGAGNVAITSAS